MPELQVSEEFLHENKSNLGQFMPISHKRGPYTKQELEKRRNEVYRYHFEYGYSARKIAELLKINCNTINGDITYWYSKIAKSNDIQPESAIFTVLERLDIQRTRIREYLDQPTSNISDKIAIEKILLDIDFKIAQVNHKLADSGNRITDYAMEFLNKYLKSTNSRERYLSINQKLSVSKSASKQIDKVISEDKKNLWSRQN
ncbi:MAG: hypothetical protein OER82_10925 [Nitrosopumilus sp.]|nr:hypothetical protein [Nitrosopumilus sp.]